MIWGGKRNMAAKSQKPTLKFDDKDKALEAALAHSE